MAVEQPAHHHHHGLHGVILAATSAYAFSRWRFHGRNAFLVFLLTTQMIPAAMMMVPLYIIAARLGLINTYRGLVIAYSVSSVPFSIWILKGYYDTIPGVARGGGDHRRRLAPVHAVADHPAAGDARARDRVPLQLHELVERLPAGPDHAAAAPDVHLAAGPPVAAGPVRHRVGRLLRGLAPARGARDRPSSSTRRSG